MNKKILVACNDPGGTMACLPVIKRLMGENNIRVHIYAGGIAQNILNSENIPYKTFPLNCIYKKDLWEIEGVLDKEKPDLVFTSTSFGKVIDNAILFTAIKREIKTVALLDQWCNYSQRFRIYTPNRNHEYLPNVIGVMDVFAKSEMIKEGFPPERLIIMGHPYFDSITIQKKDLSAIEKLNFKKEYNIDKENILIVFAAEPFRPWDLKKIGYTDITIANQLVRAIESISKETRKKITLLIKLHPRDKRRDTAFFVNAGKNVRILLVRGGQAIKFILNADIVAGMSSIFLLESFLLGKPTISIQIDRKIEDDLITSKIGLTKPIKSYPELYNALLEIINGSSKKRLKRHYKEFPWLDGKSTERALSFIKGML
jgi:hypothetical protein